MGMAAGQARLLSITARLSDNESTGQALSYTKQRLANQTEQINAAYNEALNATKLQVLTSFNNSIANYANISYGLMTGFNSVACGRQYVVTDSMGRILVTKEQKAAYEKGNGDYNIFLAELGYTQIDFTQNVSKNDEVPEIDNDGNITIPDTNPITLDAKQKIHEAWDKYIKSVGLSFYDEEHEYMNDDIVYGYNSFGNTTDPKYNTYLNGYATYTINDTPQPLNYIGTTKEQREYYDYAMALTSYYYSVGNTNHPDASAQTYAEEAAGGNIDFITLKTENDVESGYINYLKNIFQKMQSCGYFVEENESTIKDDKWFESQIKEGKLFLQYYNATEKKFVATTVSEDDAIQEVEDESAIAKAEAKYTQDLAALEKKDQILDLQLRKIDTEHNALQSEYDAVKNVISKNVEKTFNLFS